MHPAPMFRDQDKLDRLYDRALHIQAGLRPGLCEPIFRALAVRNYDHGQVLVACDFATEKMRENHPASSAYWYRKAWRSGNSNAAQHMAMNCFAANDLQGYRRWLRRAAQLGDSEAAFQLGKFATRLPIARLRTIRRARPEIRRRTADGQSFEMW
jgi:TPR repeat protein